MVGVGGGGCSKIITVKVFRSFLLDLLAITKCTKRLGRSDGRNPIAHRCDQL